MTQLQDLSLILRGAQDKVYDNFTELFEMTDLGSLRRKVNVFCNDGEGKPIGSSGESAN